jgi:hypothetical protein
VLLGGLLRSRGGARLLAGGGRLGSRGLHVAGRLGRRSVAGPPRRRTSGGLVDHPEHLTHLHVVAVAPIDAAQHASLRSAHLEVDLVGLELHQRITGGDDLPFLAQPLGDAGVDDRFSDFGHDDV